MKSLDVVWDSDFFDLKIGQISLIKNDNPLEILATLCRLKEQNYDLIYVFSEERITLPKQNGIAFSGKLVDQKVLYVTTVLENTDVLKEDKIVSVSEMTEELLMLAIESGAYSRFNLDSNFDNSSFEKLYNIWIKKSVSREIANEVFVYKNENKILGMVTVKIDNNHAKIGLIAVSEKVRGENIGSKLIQRVKLYCLEKGVEKLEVFTQLNNKFACSFYEKNNFVIDTVSNVYHYWLKK